jgi:uncharacterized protein YndB with AHSA1/START domain
VIDGGRVVHEVRYPHPVQAVWHALTDPASLSAWLMPTDFAPAAGHRFRLDARPEFGFIDGEVVDVSPPHLLRCRWTVEGVPTVLTVRLQADGTSGTLLRLEHSGLPEVPGASFDGGWGAKLTHDLGLVLGGVRDPARSRVEQGLHRHPDLDQSP